MKNGGDAFASAGTKDDSIANKAASADQNLTTGLAQYGRHVVEFIGSHLPWSECGRIAIQHFRCAEPSVYFIGSYEGAIKIGHSICPLERLAAFQLGSPLPLRIMALTDGGQIREKEYHRQFAEFRSHGEWFDRAPEVLAEIYRINPLEEWTDDDR